MKCSEFIEGITDLAFGKSAAAASEHVAGCVKCASTLRDLKQMAAVFSLGYADAPVEVVRRAAEIDLPNRASTLGLVRSSLGTVGARRTATASFQSVFEGNGVQVRTMYTRSGSKWHVMATVIPEIDMIEVNGRRMAPVDGKFEFTSKSLDDTGFQLITENGTLAVPPGSDSSSNG